MYFFMMKYRVRFRSWKMTRIKNIKVQEGEKEYDSQCRLSWYWLWQVLKVKCR